MVSKSVSLTLHSVHTLSVPFQVKTLAAWKQQHEFARVANLRERVTTVEASTLDEFPRLLATVSEQHKDLEAKIRRGEPAMERSGMGCSS